MQINPLKAHMLWLPNPDSTEMLHRREINKPHISQNWTRMWWVCTFSLLLRPLCLKYFLLYQIYGTKFYLIYRNNQHLVYNIFAPSWSHKSKCPCPSTRQESNNWLTSTKSWRLWRNKYATSRTSNYLKKRKRSQVFPLKTNSSFLHLCI